MFIIGCLFFFIYLVKVNNSFGCNSYISFKCCLFPEMIRALTVLNKTFALHLMSVCIFMLGVSAVISRNLGECLLMKLMESEVECVFSV